MNINVDKILLINPPWYRLFGFNSIFSPLGLCYIAAVLEKHGYDVSIYNADYNSSTYLISEYDITANYKKYQQTLKNINNTIWREINRVIRNISPDFVGISVTTPKYGSALNISKLVKNFNPDIPVIWGGPHPTILPDDTIKNRNVDIIVRGEGEYTFRDLIENFNRPNKVDGITYKKRGRIIHNKNRPLISNLDRLPFPARHLILGKDNYPPEAFGNVFASRGCPHKCIFCASHKIWGKKVRFSSPKNVVEEIKLIHEKYGTKFFRFEDDNLLLNKVFVEQLCDLLVKEDMHIKWIAETRVDSINEKLIKKMKVAGCDEISIGVESGDEYTLRQIKKGITIDQIKTANRIINKNNIRVSAFFIIGFPWETKKQIRNTIDMMKELDPFTAIFSIATPYPETKLFSTCVDEGLISKNLDWSSFFHQSPAMFFNKRYSREEKEEIIHEAEKIFKNHNRKRIGKMLFTNPSYIIRRVREGRYYSPRIIKRLLFQYIQKY